MELNYPTKGLEIGAPSFIAAVLNCEVKGSLQRIVERYFPDEGVEKTLNCLFPLDREREEFVEELRRLVNQWLDSGKQKALDGSIVDDPWKRRANQQALRIFTKISRESHSLECLILEDGRVQFNLKLPDPAREKERRLAVGSMVVWWYTMLLDSPRRECFCKCDLCGEYFLRFRMPKRHPPTKTGIFCPRHKKQRKSRSIFNSRLNRHRMLVELASKFWSEWDGEKRRELRSDWIARRMRREMRSHPKRLQSGISITRKWVTRNSAAIEAELKRRKDAKG